MIKNRGFTLFDTIAATLIIFIIIVAGLDVHVLVKRLHNQQTDMIHALYLASSEIEDLKYLASNNRGNQQLGAGNHEVSSGHTLYDNGSIPNGWEIDYDVTTYSQWPAVTYDDPNGSTGWIYKEVIVTCRYGSNPLKEITLTGYIF